MGLVYASETGKPIYLSQSSVGGHLNQRVSDVLFSADLGNHVLCGSAPPPLGTKPFQAFAVLELETTLGVTGDQKTGFQMLRHIQSIRILYLVVWWIRKGFPEEPGVQTPMPPIQTN